MELDRVRSHAERVAVAHERGVPFVPRSIELGRAHPVFVGLGVGAAPIGALTEPSVSDGLIGVELKDGAIGPRRFGQPPSSEVISRAREGS